VNLLKIVKLLRSYFLRDGKYTTPSINFK